jgi:FKBP-type peptidyl-prolyl cis-trans isomerase FklB
MKFVFKSFLPVAAVAALATAQSRAEDAPQFKDSKEKVSYAVGANMGNFLKRNGFEIDYDAFLSAVKDVTTGKTPKLTDAQVREVLMNYQKEQAAKKEEGRKQLAEKNKKDGAAFLTANKSKPGILTKSVAMPDGSTAEIQYKILAEGSGSSPGSNDTVSVNYRGTLLNGTEFDSSAKHGPVFKTPITRVVRGWTETLQMMKKGSKWDVYLPSSLAYGDVGFGTSIEPGAALHFEMELVDFETPPPPAPPQPLTSDIIRVPSAEELKNGAKVEVIKAEDVEKKLQSEGKKP